MAEALPWVMVVLLPVMLGVSSCLDHSEKMACIEAKGDWVAAQQACKFPKK